MQQENIYDKIQNGDYFDALFLAERAYLKERNNINRLIDYVIILLKLNKLNKAQQILQNSKLKPSDNPNIYFLYSQLYSSQGEIEKLKKLNNVNPYYSNDFQYNYVNQSFDAETDFERSYFKKQLMNILSTSIKKYSYYSIDIKKIILIIQNVSLERGKKSLNDFAHKISNKIFGYFLLGELALLDGKYEVAKKRYEKILDSYPERYVILNRLGDIELSLNNTKKAKMYYIKAINLKPDDFNTTIDIIRTYIKENKLRKAKKAYLKAILKFDERELIQIKRFIDYKENRTNKKFVNGLAWYQGGGNVIKIEISSEEGKGLLKTNGNLGFQLLDAIKLSFVVSSNYFTKLTREKINKNIFVNIPNTLVYVDGPSIGLAVTIGILAELLGKKIPHNLAFTGEITLNGDVYPIGGLKWKLTAAYLEGIETTLIPKNNLTDLLQIPESVKSKLNINLVNNIYDVERFLWKN